MRPNLAISDFAAWYVFGKVFCCGRRCIWRRLKSSFVQWLLTPWTVHKFISKTVAVSLLDLQPVYNSYMESSSPIALKLTSSRLGCTASSPHSIDWVPSSRSSYIQDSWIASVVAKASATFRSTLSAEHSSFSTSMDACWTMPILSIATSNSNTSSTGPQNCSSHSSSEQSQEPGPLQIRQSGSLPFWSRYCCTFRSSNLWRPRHWTHGQWIFWTLYFIALYNSRIHKRSSRSHYLRLSDKGSLAGIIFSVTTNYDVPLPLQTVYM